MAGSFDDCQAIVKNLFADDALRAAWHLTTVNSINMLRILAQIVYYFYAASRLDAPPNFVVPTGNFGDIFAGYAAMRCGLPVGKLVVACNSNDILTRFFATGTMTPHAVVGTFSPSMDIQISSNFERLLFDLCDGDAAIVQGLMQDLKAKGGFTVSPAALDKARQNFAAGHADDRQTLQTIAAIYRDYGYMLDPHTAVGIKVARDMVDRLSRPVVCLATAHPAKFPDTVQRAIGVVPPVPPQIIALQGKQERTARLPANRDAVKSFISERIKT